jgi:hypothetical protein
VFHSNIGFILKYARYTFFLLSHISSTLAKLESTANITVVEVYPNIYMTQKARKILKEAKRKL